MTLLQLNSSCLATYNHREASMFQNQSVRKAWRDEEIFISAMQGQNVRGNSFGCKVVYIGPIL